jgi:hypothetical protein
MLVARFVFSQMDVPARQAYVASVVLPDERSAAGGVANVARSVGLALAPLLVGELAGGAGARGRGAVKERGGGWVGVGGAHARWLAGVA